MKLYKDDILRHSAAHLLAHALFELYPNTIFTLGPSTETGFFYDILPVENIKEADLFFITEKMKEIVKRNLSIIHNHISKEEAKKLFKNNIFKLEIIENQIKDDLAGITYQGNFIDLCKGGHVEFTGVLEHFMLTGISGSYWRGDKSNQSLQRISGVIFNTKKELDNYIEKKEWAELYDHRRLGKEMDLFSFAEEGPGFPFLHPKGMIIVNELQNFIRNITKKADYQEIRTPIMLKSSLWKKSGHYEHYKDNMYFSEVDNQEYAIKPMNCPGSFLVFDSRPRSYRELPLRLSEMGHVHRHELSGTLHGLFRVRAFTQDDAHIFCKLSDVEAEITRILILIDEVLIKTGFFNVEFFLSTKPEKAFGDDALWSEAVMLLKNSLEKLKKPFFLKEGDGAFYGPKIEVKVKDIFDRLWTCGTIQLDFFQSENFDLNYVSKDGKKERPVVIHQAILGSFERFLGMMLEHHRGILPIKFAPIQARILPIVSDINTYGKFIQELCLSFDIRSEIDITSDPLSAKIQKAQRDKIPYMIIIGRQEEVEKKITIRKRDGTCLKLIDPLGVEFKSIFNLQ